MNPLSPILDRIAIAVALILLAALVVHWRYTAGYAAGVAYTRAQDTLAAAEQVEKWNRSQRIKDDAHQKELAELRDRAAAQPFPVVRVCPKPAAARPREMPGAGAAQPAATGVLPPDDALHPDIAKPLELLVEYADEVIADCRAR